MTGAIMFLSEVDLPKPCRTQIEGFAGQTISQCQRRNAAAKTLQQATSFTGRGAGRGRWSALGFQG